MSILSKYFQSFPHTCHEYHHTWTKSCTQSSLQVYGSAIIESFRIYATVYTLALLMRGKVPNLQQLKRTFAGILQSTAFLSFNVGGIVALICTFRHLFGGVNYWSVSLLPGFVASYLAILVERPERRSLLAVYVTNVATETLFRMAARRGLVRSIPHGEVYIFMASTAILSYIYKAYNYKDTLTSLLRFVVGGSEEHGYNKSEEKNKKTSKNSENVFLQMIRNGIKHGSCRHPFSCLSYITEGGIKMFSVGYGLQVCMTLLLKMKKLVRNPSILPSLLFSKETFSLGVFLGGFSSIFRFTCCILRHARGKDSKYHGILAGLAAGTTFHMYKSNNIALYVMWKTLQMVYNLCCDEHFVPEVPWFNMAIYSLSTAILFNACMMEPSSLRPSYYRFLNSVSGKKAVIMNKGNIKCFEYGGAKFFK